MKNLAIASALGVVGIAGLVVFSVLVGVFMSLALQVK